MFEHGELVQIWDAFYDEWINEQEVLIPEHGKIGVVIYNPRLNVDYRDVLVDGIVQVFHIDHLREIPEEHCKEE